MDESDSAGSDLEEILMKYRKKVKEDRVSNRLSIESSQKSNLNISINVPSASGTTSFSVSLDGGGPSRKEKKGTLKKVSKNKSSSFKTKMPKAKTKRTENEENQTDPDYAPKSQPNYLKLTAKELNSIANRVRFYHETGVVVSDDDDVVPCQNKYKGKQKNKNQLKQGGEQVPSTKFGEGKVGTTSSRFGANRCACCNATKNKCTSHGLFGTANTVSPYADIMKGMSEEMLNQLKRREERLLQIQQRDLLQHPELLGSDDSDATIPDLPVELSQDKREWVEKYIDSMSVDRVDYEKPKKVNIVEGISQKRPSDVHPKNEDTVVDFLDAKTIVQRIDFKKEKERRSRLNQCKTGDWLKPNIDETTPKFDTKQLIATSTPKPSISVGLFQENTPATSTVSGVNRFLPQPIPSTSKGIIADTVDSTIDNTTGGFSSTTNRLIADLPSSVDLACDDFSSDFLNLDRSNITIRTPQSKVPKQFEHLSVPSSSKPKLNMSQATESDIMSFVDRLLGPEKESINQEAHERCERVLKNAETARSLLHNALNDVLITDDNSNDLLDISVQIIEDDNLSGEDNPARPRTDSVELVESYNEPIPVIDISDTVDVDAPSTSRTTRKRINRGAVTRGRKRRCTKYQVVDIWEPHLPAVELITPVATRRRKRQHATPSTVSVETIQATEPASTQPVSSAETANKSSARSLRDCPICLESLANKEISSTICGHVFCTPCITAAVRAQRLCPNCRTALTLKKIHPLFI